MSLPADGGAAYAYDYAVGEEARTPGGRRLEDGERLRVLLRTSGVSRTLFATASGLSLVAVHTMCAAERIDRDKRERAALVIEDLVRARTARAAAARVDAAPLRIVGTTVALAAPPDHGVTEARATPRVRARTISIKRLSKRELERGRLLYPTSETDAYERPTTRGDCLHGPHAERPCPFVSCVHHLFLDVDEARGSIKMNFPDLEVWELAETCALDVADRGGVTLEDLGRLTAITRERVRQIEEKTFTKLRALAAVEDLRDDVFGEAPGPADAAPGRRHHKYTGRSAT